MGTLRGQANIDYPGLPLNTCNDRVYNRLLLFSGLDDLGVSRILGISTNPTAPVLTFFYWLSVLLVVLVEVIHGQVDPVDVGNFITEFATNLHAQLLHVVEGEIYCLNLSQIEDLEHLFVEIVRYCVIREVQTSDARQKLHAILELSKTGSRDSSVLEP